MNPLSIGCIAPIEQKNSNIGETAMSKYVSLLTLDECCQVFDHWIQDNLKSTSTLTITSVGATKAKAKFNIGQTRCTATININYNEHGYCNAVLMAYHRGAAEPVSIKRAVDNFGGTSRESNYWVQLQYDRFIAMKNNFKNKVTNTAERHNTSDLLEQNAKKNAEQEFENDKADFLSRLPGAAIAQYMYKAAKAMQAPEYHYNQVVRSPDQHRYNIKKGFSNPDDFLIMPNHTPSMNQILKFIHSEKFDMPENPYGFTNKDIISQIEHPPQLNPNSNKPETFDIQKYVTPKDISHGVGLMPSMDINGVITNTQKYLVEPLADGTDKIFAKQAIVRGSCYVFDHERKLNTDYKPRNILMVEGWATGESLNKLFNTPNNDSTMVVVAWNAGQIKNATKLYANHYPEANIIIGADNDVKSFFKANEKNPEELKLVRNTGIQVAIETCNALPELSNRLNILLPTINHEKLSKDKCPSDFDDIKRDYGVEQLKINITEEIVEATQRRKVGTEEIPRLVDTYNAQAKFFSDLYGIALHTIEPNGELSAKPYMPEVLINAAKEAEVRAEMEQDDLINQMASDFNADFFDVDVNEDIKSEFDKKLELSACLFNGGFDDHEPEVTNLVVNTLAPTVDAPAEQPIIDPATFTAVLYQSHLFNTFSQIQDLNNKQEMLEALEAQPMSMNSAQKVMQAMFDSTINPHLPKLIDNVINDYKDQPFYNDLTEIRAIMDENYIQLNEESIQFMKEAQREVVNNFVLQNQHKGLDNEVADKVIDLEISSQPVESKRLLFTELRDTMKSLDASDESWLHSIKEALLESKQVASSINHDNEKSSSIEYSH